MCCSTSKRRGLEDRKSWPNFAFFHGGGGNAENVGTENAGPMMSVVKDQNAVLENAGLTMQGWKMKDMKTGLDWTRSSSLLKVDDLI